MQHSGFIFLLCLVAKRKGMVIIMELQEQKNHLKSELSSAKQKIVDLTEPNNVAFEGCNVSINFIKNDKNNSKSEVKITRSLSALFKIVATQMMDVEICEKAVCQTLCEQLWGRESFRYQFKDLQFIKRLLNQFKGANLIYSSWDDKMSELYWGLTIKGEKIRNDMILIKCNKKEEDS